MNRNHEKEIAFYQQEIMKIISEKIAVQAILDDALNEIKELKEKYEVQDVERKEISE